MLCLSYSKQIPSARAEDDASQAYWDPLCCLKVLVALAGPAIAKNSHERRHHHRDVCLDNRVDREQPDAQSGQRLARFYRQASSVRILAFILSRRGAPLPTQASRSRYAPRVRVSSLGIGASIVTARLATRPFGEVPQGRVWRELF
jgi:hypothetical protein